MPPYQASKAGADAGLLAAELTAAELPVDPDGGVRGPDADGVVTVATTRELSAEEQADLTATVAAHNPVIARRLANINAMLTSTDPFTQQFVALFRLAFTLVNDERELRGAPRLQEPELIQMAAALLPS